MDDQQITDEMEPVFNALREHRGECPETDRLIGIDDLDEAERTELLLHLEVCPTCAAVVRPEEEDFDDLSWQRTARLLDARPKPWLESGQPTLGRRFRRPLLIAATLVIALAAATLWRQSEVGPEIPDNVSSQRGSSIQAVAPAGTIAKPVVFRWQTVLPLDLDYRVELEVDGKVLWHGETTKTSLEPPARLVEDLDRGRVYRWRVLGVDHETVIAESGWVEFTLAP